MYNTFSISIIQQKISNHHEKKIFLDGNRHASVLVPLVMLNGTLHLLLTKRTDSVEHHKGQISFPGGMVDACDDCATSTALRETEEEIGVPREAVKVLGSLNDILIPTGFIVTPVVGYIEPLPELITSKDEVAEILFIPLEKFFDESLQHTETRELKGKTREVYFYDVWKEPVWGATALIIKEFTEIISKL